MTTSFRRTVGPKADVQELEYICALHQTCSPKTRSSGTISSIDIQRYLLSRHALCVHHSQARDIVRGLGGGGGVEDSLPLAQSAAHQWSVRLNQEQARMDALENHPASKWRFFSTSRKNRKMGDTTPTNNKSNLSINIHKEDIGEHDENNDNDEDQDPTALLWIEEALHPKILYLDPVQITSILLMPTLARMGQEEEQTLQAQQPSEKPQSLETKPSLDPPAGMFDLVLQTMHTVLRSKQQEDDDPDNGGSPVWVTPELVQTLLLENGEMEKARNPKLIQEMVAMATTTSTSTRTNSRGGVECGLYGKFNVQALIQAVTSDLSDWKVGSEDQQSTYNHDIFESHSLDDIGSILTEQQPTNFEKEPPKVQPQSFPRSPLDTVPEVVQGPAREKYQSDNNPEVSFLTDHGDHDPDTVVVAEDHVDIDVDDVISKNLDNDDDPLHELMDNKQDDTIDQDNDDRRDNGNNDNDNSNHEDHEDTFFDAVESLLGLNFDNVFASFTNRSSFRHSSTDNNHISFRNSRTENTDLGNSSSAGAGLIRTGSMARGLMGDNDHVKMEGQETSINGKTFTNNIEDHAALGATSSISEDGANDRKTGDGGNPSWNGDGDTTNGSDNLHSPVGPDAAAADSELQRAIDPPISHGLPARNFWNDKTDDCDGDLPYTVNSARAIDSIVDAYGSTATNLLIWITYAVFSASYVALVLRTNPFVLDCPKLSFGCTLTKTVLSWYVIVFLVLYALMETI
mgnify:CR=1 FL=1